MSDKKIIFTFIILLSVFFTSSGLLTFLGKINTYAILMLTFFIIGLNIVSRHREYLKTKYIPLLIAYIVPIIISYLYGSTAIFNRHIAYATLFLCTPVYIIIKKNYNQKEQFLFYSFCVCLSVLNAIISYIHLENNPYACRQAHVVQASGESVGGYDFVCFSACVAPSLLYVALKVQSTRFKIIFILLYIFLILFILKASFTTALISSLIASMIILLEHVKKNTAHLVLFLLSLATIIPIFLLINLKDKFINILPPRIQQIFSNQDISFTDSLYNEFVSDRLPLISKSFNSFMDNGFIGAIQYGENAIFHIGNHSFIFDTIALFGIIGIVTCLMYFHVLFSNVSKSSLQISAFVVFLILLIFNVACNSMAWAVFIICPLSHDVIKYLNTQYK